MQQKLPVILVALGLLLLVGFAIIQWGMLPMFLGEKVVQGMRLFYGPTGAGEHWKRFGLPSFAILNPTLLLVYFHNVTNPVEVIQNGIKPILHEVGPYVYTVEVITELSNATEQDNETTSFRERKTYHFNQHLSGKLTEDDEINVLNIPFLKVVDAIDNLPKNKSILGSLLLNKRSDRDQDHLLFIQHPVRELLFTGFTQPSLEKAQKFVERNASPFLLDDKFGFLYSQNGSISKPFKVYHGLVPKNIGNKSRDYSQVIEYDGKGEMEYWAHTEENHCNQIDGTSDGMIFDPVAIRKNLKVSIFRPEMCRSLSLRMNGHVENHNGLNGYRFILPPQLLQDSSINYENNCLCPSPGVAQFNSCVKAGTLSNCREGFPFITSLPHFLDSSGQPYLTQVVGLSPNRAKHGSFIDMEPVTGLALKSSMKFQLNYEVKPSGSHDDMKKISNMLYPLLWTDEIKSMHFILSKGIQEKVMMPVMIMELTKWPIFVLGLILFAAGLIIYIVRARKKNYPIYFNTLLISKESGKFPKKRNRKVSFSSKSKSKPVPSPAVVEPFLSGLQRQSSRLSLRSKLTSQNGAVNVTSLAETKM